MNIICIRAKDIEDKHWSEWCWERFSDKVWSGIDSAEEDEDFIKITWEGENSSYTYDFVSEDYFNKFKNPYW